MQHANSREVLRHTIELIKLKSGLYYGWTYDTDIIDYIIKSLKNMNIIDSDLAASLDDSLKNFPDKYKSDIENIKERIKELRKNDLANT
jgi:predicted transcriptional regulator